MGVPPLVGLPCESTEDGSVAEGARGVSAAGTEAEVSAPSLCKTGLTEASLVWWVAELCLGKAIKPTRPKSTMASTRRIFFLAGRWSNLLELYSFFITELIIP